MTRILYVAAAAFVLVFCFRQVRNWLASDEEKIRALVERMVDGVEDSDSGQILGGIDRDRYRDATSGLRHADLHQALLYLFLQQRKDLDPELVDLQIAPLEDVDPPRATVSFHCRIEELLSNGTRKPWWEFTGVGELEKIEGDWRFIETREIDHTHRPR